MAYKKLSDEELEIITESKTKIFKRDLELEKARLTEELDRVEEMLKEFE